MRLHPHALAIHIALAAHAGAAPSCEPPVIDEAHAASVVDGGSFDLADGRRVRLAGILAPREGEAYALEAAADLTRLVTGKTVGIAPADPATDRHGRLLAFVSVDGAWVDQTLLRKGAARVLVQLGSRSCAKQRLADEAGARTARRGLWAMPAYRLRAPDEVTAHIGTYQIVEGRILSVTPTRDRIYLNFGADYRQDFTATIASVLVKRLRRAAINPHDWQARTVRVRGWVSLLNGPELELTHAEQIEVTR